MCNAGIGLGLGLEVERTHLGWLVVAGAVYYALQVSFIPIVENRNRNTLTRVLLAVCAAVRIVGFVVLAVEAADPTATYFAIYPTVHVTLVDAVFYSFFML